MWVWEHHRVLHTLQSSRTGASPPEVVKLRFLHLLLHFLWPANRILIGQQQQQKKPQQIHQLIYKQSGHSLKAPSPHLTPTENIYYLGVKIKKSNAIIFFF